MKNANNTKILHRIRRHKKIRSKVSGTTKMPRLSVFRSNKYIYAQLIDDVNGVTIVSESDINVKGKNKTERAKSVGGTLAEKAKKKKIDKVVFDRGGFLYIGRIKALAEEAKKVGLIF